MKMKKRMKTKPRILGLFLFLLGCLLAAGQTWAQTQPSGAGTQDNPYKISTADELLWFAGLVNGTLTDGTEQNAVACAVMTKDIDLTGADWTPIGNSSNKYTGTFDGGGHTIDGMTIQSSDTNLGFVGYLSTNGTIQNLTLGKNCSVSGDVNTVGGVCGTNSGGTIQNCVNYGKVIGADNVGGVCGYNSGIITNCYNSGMVEGLRAVGGVSGYNSGTITNCYNSGMVEGPNTVGGICGGNSGTIKSCYNTGAVSGGMYKGSVCGSNFRTVTNCYWLTGTADTDIGTGNGEATGKSADDFKSGAVCWLLNGSTSEGNLAWYQTLGEDGDKFPVLDSTHGTVYYGEDCLGNNTYGNSPLNGEHNYVNGICTFCGGYQPAEQVEGVYQIANAGQLFWLSDLVNGYLTDTQNTAADAVLTADITLVQTLPWTPIGNESNPYTGTFDGQGHTISKMLVDTDAGYQGFVGYLGDGGTIMDLTLGEGCSVTGGKYTGGLCGWSTGGIIAGCTNMGAVNGNGDLGGVCGHNLGTVKNCTNAGKVTNSGAETVGGICGYSSTSLIGCTNSGVIDGSDQRHVGGICGYIDNGDKGVTVSVCTNTGAVTGNNERVGGICGFGDVTITNCWNSGAITGGTNVGGICGENHSKAGTIMNCYSTGEVRGNGNVGGICGENNRTVDNSYWLEETCDFGIGNSRGTATEKTAEQFKSGAVAVLLQGDQTELAWGQAIGTDEYPVLTTDEAKKVYAYSIYKGNSTAEPGYANDGAAAISLEGNAVAVVETAGFTVADDKANVIVKDGDGTYTCGSLVLTDGADFYTPVAFTATEATYSRTLPSTSTWGTIALPFAVADVSGASLYQADGVVNESGEESILAVIPTGGSTLEANTPALFKGESDGSEVSFRASDAEVAATDKADLTKAIGESDYNLNGSMSTITLKEGDLFISKDMFWSVGTKNTVGMQAFRAYIDAPSSSPAKSMRIMIGSTSDIRQAVSGGSRLVDVYSLQGIMLRKGVESGKALNGLPSGVYVVDGKKVMSK